MNFEVCGCVVMESRRYSVYDLAPSSKESRTALKNSRCVLHI